MTEPGVEDATRRTRLASERTYLAWWRTGLTALAVAVGIGRLAPALTHPHAARWPFEAVGAGYGVLGLAFIGVAYARSRALERALAQGTYSPLQDRFALVLTVAGVLLGAATIALVFAVR